MKYNKRFMQHLGTWLLLLVIPLAIVIRFGLVVTLVYYFGIFFVGCILEKIDTGLDSESEKREVKK